MKQHEFDVGYWVLDDQLIDADGRRCGRVDDVEFDGGPGRRTTLAAIRSGPGAARRRVPRLLRGLASRLFSDHEVRVPWSEVKEIRVVVVLKKRAAEYGLAAGDLAAKKIIEKIPGAG
jgi:sporulation protein YlmC with PRC-barrel domain